MKLHLALVFLFIAISSFGQNKNINYALKTRLDSIGHEDQRYRLLLDNISPRKTDSLAALYHIAPDSVYSYCSRLQHAIDTWCIYEVETIIKKYGYPGKRLVGQPTNEVVFYVIQHSDKITQYLPLLEKAAKRHELDFGLVAMMQDRFLTEQGKEQLYGTQLWGNTLVKDSLTGVMKPFYYFCPIKDKEKVNERRRKAGMRPIEDYAAEMGIPYRIKKPDWWK